MNKVIQLRDKDGNNAFPVCSDETIRQLYIGRLVKGSPNPSTGQIISSDSVVSMADTCSIPYQGVTVNIKVPDGWTVTIYHNDTSRGDTMAYPTTSYCNAVQKSFSSSGSYTFPTGNGTTTLSAQVYRVSFSCKGKSISADDVRALLESGGIILTYKSYVGNVVTRNWDVEPAVRSASIRFKNGMADAARTLGTLPLFVHGSDFHGDAYRFKNFLDYADYINADAALASGDFIHGVGYDGMNYVEDIGMNHKTPLIVCTGNHDNCMYSVQDFYNTPIKALSEKFGYQLPKNVSTPTYYYKDFDKKKIRVIALNIYMNSGNSIYVNMDSNQKAWLISTLKSTPSGYGVLIVEHAPFRAISAAKDLTSFYHYFVLDIDNNDGMDSLLKIVDAFISRGTASGTWGGHSSSYSYNVDFSTLASGVEFIGWVCGHLHRDCIGYMEGTSKRQLVLNINAANGLMEKGGSDLGRFGDGKSQDLFNVYGIDREQKCVKVVRVGSNVNCDMEGLKPMSIPYA